MWMADPGRKTVQEAGAEVGQVTLGEEIGVALAGERRGLPLCAPGGYRWAPRQGDTVLVIKTGAEEAPCVAGEVMEPGEPGEITISAGAGSGIRLRRDGTVELTGRVLINGKEV